MLLQTERLADALAEGEFHDMGLNKKAGEEALARLIHDLRTPGQVPSSLGSILPTRCDRFYKLRDPALIARRTPVDDASSHAQPQQHRAGFWDLE